jgi:hypothetical protein
MEKMKIIKDRMKTAWDRKKRYVDKRRRPYLSAATSSTRDKAGLDFKNTSNFDIRQK